MMLMMPPIHGRYNVIVKERMHRVFIHIYESMTEENESYGFYHLLKMLYLFKLIYACAWHSISKNSLKGTTFCLNPQNKMAMKKITFR